MLPSGASITALYWFTSAGTLLESRAHTWTAVAWAMSVVIQTSGSIIIGCTSHRVDLAAMPRVSSQSAGRIMATPVIAPRAFDPWLVLWVFVDSGALYTCVTILALSLSFPISTASYVLIFSLGQISVGSLLSAVVIRLTEPPCRPSCPSPSYFGNVGRQTRNLRVSGSTRPVHS